MVEFYYNSSRCRECGRLMFYSNKYSICNECMDKRKVSSCKIIDLLNKIANGEEVPKKIKWEEIIYVYSDYDKDYLEFPFSKEKYQGLFCMKDSILTQYLNDEVDILEDEDWGDGK